MKFQTIKSKKSSSDTTSTSAPSKDRAMGECSVNPSEVASKALVLVHSLQNENACTCTSNKCCHRKQRKKMFRRKQQQEASNRSVGTVGTDASTTYDPSYHIDPEVLVEENPSNSQSAKKKVKQIQNMAREQCSVAAEKTIFKLTDLVKKSKNKKNSMLYANRPMLTTNSHNGGVEISLPSPSRSSTQQQNQSESKSSSSRFQNWKNYKSVANKQYAKVAKKLASKRSNTEHEEEDDEDHELSPLDHHHSHDMIQNECAICDGTMSENDWNHPLQCQTPQCRYNFCATCIYNLIQSSKDAYGQASDGSNHVKVHLHCPNCRDDLGKSLQRTLLLRVADSKTLPRQERTKMMLELSGQITTKALTEKEKVMQLDSMDVEVCRARAQEREFLRSKPSPTHHRQRETPRGSRRSEASNRRSPEVVQNNKNNNNNNNNKKATGTNPSKARERFQALRKQFGQYPQDNDDMRAFNDLVAASDHLVYNKRESSFNVNQTACFYIDTQVNLGSMQPRLRFQV
ncbi:MAG: hypothetical protein SGBAC_005766 [Bacillariaceae sp.]